MDFIKAFDGISQEILIWKLDDIGIINPLLSGVVSCLLTAIMGLRAISNAKVSPRTKCLELYSIAKVLGKKEYRLCMTFDIYSYFNR